MTKAEMDRLWMTVQRLALPLIAALIIAVGGFMFANREQLHAQDRRLVAVESTVPSMTIVEERFTQILIEMTAIKGDLRVIRTEIQSFKKQYEDLCRRVEKLEAREGD